MSSWSGNRVADLQASCQYRNNCSTHFTRGEKKTTTLKTRFAKTPRLSTLNLLLLQRAISAALQLTISLSLWASTPTWGNTALGPIESIHPWVSKERELSPWPFIWASTQCQLSEEDSCLRVGIVNACRGWMANALLRLDVTLIKMETENPKAAPCTQGHLCSFSSEATEMKAKGSVGVRLYSYQLYLPKILCCKNRWHFFPKRKGLCFRELHAKIL